MTARRATFKQADVTRVLRAALAAGLVPRSYSANAVTGVIEVQVGSETESNGNSIDSIMGPR